LFSTIIFSFFYNSFFEYVVKLPQKKDRGPAGLGGFGKNDPFDMGINGDERPRKD